MSTPVTPVRIRNYSQLPPATDPNLRQAIQDLWNAIYDLQNGVKLLVRKYAADVGDGTNTSFLITHNLNTTDVQVQVYENIVTSTLRRLTVVETRIVDTTHVRLVFGAPPVANGFRVIVEA